MKHDFKAVIFDMDGLMLDTERLALYAWHRMAGEYGVSLQDALLQAMVGRNWADSEALLFTAVKRNVFPTTDLEAIWEQHYAIILQEHGIPLKAGLLTLLNYLEQHHVPKAVATSTAQELALHKLRRAGVASHFEIVIGGDQVANGKPAPDIFLTAAERLEMKPSECLVLEDSEAGVRAAHAAGMVPILIPDLVPPSETAHALAYRVCSSLYEIMDIIGI